MGRSFRPVAQMELPENALGADLLWWRTTNAMRTSVAILWGGFHPFQDVVHLRALLIPSGRSDIISWRIPLIPGQPVFIDSAASGPWRPLEGADGVLALYACTDGEPSAEARANYNRLLPILDWRAADSRIVTLHSDQVVMRGRNTKQQFTEIVVLETGEEANALVILNGEELQTAGALEIDIRNASGATLSSVYAEPMLPFSVHRVPLAALFPDVTAFAAGAPLVVSGAFESRGLFSRPYVETRGRRWGAFHAGDLYSWSPLPHFIHTLIGGEVNPVAVIHDEKVRTLVNLIHSHGDFEDDVLVKFALFDEAGHCVATSLTGRLVPRHGLNRFDVAEVLPDPDKPFRGHIALAFDAGPGKAVPRRLQALFEYRGPESIARTMAWSDEWNSRVRLAQRDRNRTPQVSKSFFRIWEDAELTTEVAITNAGHAGYNRHADVRLLLMTPHGPILETTLRLAPFATCMATIEQLFPDAVAHPGWTGIGLLVTESASDLANLAFTRVRASGAIAAEHFLPLPTEFMGRLEWPAGN